MDKSDQIREELKQMINKAILTVGVGEIAEIESFVGFLWGQNKHIDQLNQEEFECRKEWEIIRKNFFDKMNDLIKRLDKKIDSLEFEERKYTYIFYNKKNNGINKERIRK